MSCPWTTSRRWHLALGDPAGGRTGLAPSAALMVTPLVGELTTVGAVGQPDAFRRPLLQAACGLKGLGISRVHPSAEHE